MIKVRYIPCGKLPAVWIVKMVCFQHVVVPIIQFIALTSNSLGSKHNPAARPGAVSHAQRRPRPNGLPTMRRGDQDSYL